MTTFVRYERSVSKHGQHSKGNHKKSSFTWLSCVFSRTNKRKGNILEPLVVLIFCAYPILRCDLPSLLKLKSLFWIWRFPEMGVPNNGWFLLGNTLLKWMIGGYPHLWKPHMIWPWKCWFCHHFPMVLSHCIPVEYSVKANSLLIKYHSRSSIAASFINGQDWKVDFWEAEVPLRMIGRQFLYPICSMYGICIYI